MERNRELFEAGEANEFFRRMVKQLSNQDSLEKNEKDARISLLANWLKPYEKEVSNILEIGCGSGHRLNQIASEMDANGYGVDPSPDAIKFISDEFPNLQAKVGFGDSVPYSQNFDLVHLGFFLYLVDRGFYLRCISEADRLVKFGGFLSIIDFETPYPYSNEYTHRKGVYSHKQNNSEVFVASGLYSVVNKFQFSLQDGLSSINNFSFDKDINERVSLTLLYKETEIFGLASKAQYK